MVGRIEPCVVPLSADDDCQRRLVWPLRRDLLEGRLQLRELEPDDGFILALKQKATQQLDTAFGDETCFLPLTRRRGR